MSRINLLPWREELRRQRRTEFLTVTGIAAVLTVAAVWGVHYYFGQLIDYQNQRNAFLQTEIRRLDAKLKEIRDINQQRERLLARMRAIETLQSSRPVVVHMFDEIVTAVPDGVFLDEISQKGNTLTIKGTARSNGRVSTFMRNLEASQWFGKPTLQVIQTREEDRRRIADFTLQVDLLPPSGGEDDSGDLS